MNPLDLLIPIADLSETNAVDVAASPERVWQRVRHLDLGESAIAKALFGVRTGSVAELSIDGLTSSPEHPGFRVLVDEAPHAFAVGAIGKVWKIDIPFVHVESASDFESYREPREVKVAWAVRVEPLTPGGSRVVVEVRVKATDAVSLRRFRAYFALIGPGSRLIRRAILARLVREFGALDDADESRALPGDDVIDAREQATHSITVNARAEEIWPWLVQMGSGRAGFYSIDWLDNAGKPSAREVHREWQQLRVGDVIPARPGSAEGFEVLRLEAERALVLGAEMRDGERTWKSTWAFVLEPLDASRTRVIARARAAATGMKLRLAWIRPVHAVMEHAQLRHLAERAEHRLPRDTFDDRVAACGGAALMVASFLTPFLRFTRSHWGLSEAEANRARPGDELIPEPSWGWTHGIEIDADANDVWPWIAQIGADRGGFYSYQFLENVAGCNLKNAETIHPEWEVREGGKLSLHPKMPPLSVVSVLPGYGFVAHAAADESARASGKPWSTVTWAFFVDDLGPGCSRLVSRYRCATSDDLATRLALGPACVEPIGFAMDRRMLLGVKERAERRHIAAAP